MTRRIVSGSTRSPRLVKPVTSQNSTVTVLRTRGSAASAMSSESRPERGEAPRRLHCLARVRHCLARVPTPSNRLQDALGDLRKRGRLDGRVVSRSKREIRLALLEAGVNG